MLDFLPEEIREGYSPLRAKAQEALRDSIESIRKQGFPVTAKRSIYISTISFCIDEDGDAYWDVLISNASDDRLCAEVSERLNPVVEIPEPEPNKPTTRPIPVYVRSEW